MIVTRRLRSFYDFPPKSSDVPYSCGCSDRRVDIAGEGWQHESRLSAFLCCFLSSPVSWWCKLQWLRPHSAAILPQARVNGKIRATVSDGNAMGRLGASAPRVWRRRRKERRRHIRRRPTSRRKQRGGIAGRMSVLRRQEVDVGEVDLRLESDALERQDELGMRVNASAAIEWVCGASSLGSM
jgi:hypothetical protein